MSTVSSQASADDTLECKERNTQDGGAQHNADVQPKVSECAANRSSSVSRVESFAKASAGREHETGLARQCRIALGENEASHEPPCSACCRKQVDCEVRAHQTESRDDLGPFACSV
jgi:hypothetical protein